MLRAACTNFRQRVAIRVLPPALMQTRAVQRFVRETKILGALESEHVARVQDVGVLPGGALYLVREFVEGTSLSELSRAGNLPLSFALDLFLQACEAVGEAHSRGVVLRDLQLRHAFVTHLRNGEPRLKITDFGTCKVLRRAERDADASCTQVLGLSASASPELLCGRHVDERADVWSLGCMLYELLTGRPPFVAEGAALMLAIARGRPVPPSQLRPDIPAEIDRLVLAALRKDRDERPATVFALVRPLRRYASARAVVLLEQIARLAGEEPTALNHAGSRRDAPSSQELRSDLEAEAPLVMVRSLVPSTPGAAVHRLPLPPPLPRPSPPARTAAPANPAWPPHPRESLHPWESMAPPPLSRRLLPVVSAAAVITALLTVAAILLVDVGPAADPPVHAAHRHIAWVLAATDQRLAELRDQTAYRVAAEQAAAALAASAATPRPRRRRARKAAPPSPIVAAPVPVKVSPAPGPEAFPLARPRVEPASSPFLAPVDDLSATRDARRRARRQ